MKHFLRSFFLLLLVIVWSSNALAVTSPYSYTFKSGGSFTDDKQTKTLGGVNWTITSDGYLSFEGGSNKAQQIGSKKKPAKNTVISTSDFPGTIKAIEINGWQGDDANANVEVFVGDVSYGKKAFSNKKEDNLLFNGTSSGALKIQIINPASNGSIAAYIKTISVTYEDGPTKTATKLNFPQPAIIIEGGNEASFKGQTATLKTGETVLDKAITYAKSGDDIFATFDATTGAATLKTGVYGSATITATFAGDDTYEKSTASYDLTVVDPNKSEVTFNFSDCTKYGYKKPSSNSKRTELNIGDVIKSSPVTITVVDEGDTKVGFATTYLGVYQGSTLKLEIEDGYVLNEVSFERNGTNNTLSINANNAGETWTGEASSVTLSVPDQAKGTQVKTITVKYSKLANSLTLSETDADTDSKIANNNGKTVDVTLTRTLTANAWNTICLPFDVTKEQIGDVLKSADNVKEFDREDASKQTIYFKDATTMTAGKPYLIKPTESATELVFKGVTIKNVGESDRKFGSNYKICGTFGKYTMKTDGTELFLKTDGKFYIPAAGTATMKGFRAYFFNINGSTAGAALNLSFGEATGIDGVAADAEKNVKVYNVNGQYVGTSLDALPKGLYIVGGKKVLK